MANSRLFLLPALYRFSANLRPICAERDADLRVSLSNLRPTCAANLRKNDREQARERDANLPIAIGLLHVSKVCCHMLQGVTGCCRMLQGVSVCCSAFRGVAACTKRRRCSNLSSRMSCSVVQCVAVRDAMFQTYVGGRISQRLASHMKATKNLCGRERECVKDREREGKTTIE